MPVFADRVDELKDWDQIKLLTVAVDRLDRWHRPGLLCIGDAAHAMSPIGGVGVNLAVQDAVAAANILWQPLKAATVTEDDLDRVREAAKISHPCDPAPSGLHSESRSSIVRSAWTRASTHRSRCG